MFPFWHPSVGYTFRDHVGDVLQRIAVDYDVICQAGTASRVAATFTIETMTLDTMYGEGSLSLLHISQANLGGCEGIAPKVEAQKSK